ncbi:hypothetical protein [Acidocella facilis]|uniref:hypothetical protein n=1 Tax=Acidocella facilis TaxID=525 RepID=UPI0012DDC3CC|nr:hypothetical protein [Acidocella facilis]
MILAFPKKPAIWPVFLCPSVDLHSALSSIREMRGKCGTVNRDGYNGAALDEPTASPDSASRDMMIWLMNDAKFRGAAADMEPHIESLKENA